MATKLNQIAALLNTTDRVQVLAVATATLVKAGYSGRDALDIILGDGTFDQLAGDVYDRFNA